LRTNLIAEPDSSEEAVTEAVTEALLVAEPMSRSTVDVEVVATYDLYNINRTGM